MGNSQSTRKITVPNESAHIIKISDSVIDRLKNIENSSARSGSKQSISPVKSSTFSGPSISSAPAYSGTLTSLDVLQEKERQLKENDAYWANRVGALESARANTTRLMEEEFSKTVAAVEARLPKRPTKLSEAPCGDKKAKVIECYKSHPKQILLCAKEVAEFADCVDLKRLSTA